MISGDIPDERLFALLQFEAQKHSIYIMYRSMDLEDFTPEPFRPQIEVISNTNEGACHVLTIGDTYVGLLYPVNLPEGELIYFQNKPVATVMNRYLFLFFNVRGMPGSAINQLCGAIFDQAFPKLAEYIKGYDYRGESRNYSEVRMRLFERRLKNMEYDINANEERIQEISAQLRELYLKNDELRNLLAMHRCLTTMMKKRGFEKEFLKLMELVPERIEYIAYNTESLDVTTREIEIDHYGGYYHLGKFKVEVWFERDDIKISNETNEVNGYPHPHVSSDGTPCWGNLVTGINRLLAEGDYFSLITVILQFLSSYNEDNPFQKIEYWDPDFNAEEAERERYEDCYENVSLQDCVACGDSDCPFYENAQEHCREGASNSDCIRCSNDNCRYHRVAMEDCMEEHGPGECVLCDMSRCIFAGDEESCHQMHGGEECEECDIETCQYHPSERRLSNENQG